MYSDYEGKYFIQQGKLFSDINDVQSLNKEGFIYEVIRVLDGKLLLFRSHISRLQQSIRLKGWPELNETEQICEGLKQLIALNAIENQNIKIRVDLVENELCIILYPVHSRYPSKALYHDGALTALFAIERNDPNAKAFDHNMLIAREALAQSGLQELLLVNHLGHVTEGSKSNVVFMKGKTLYSAPEKDILLGITRVVLKHAVKNSDFEWIEEPVHKDELDGYDGAFLTGTSIHLLPIHAIGDVVYETEENLHFKELTALFLNQINREHEEDFK